MTTLAEIESAVARLPLPEQEELLRHLEMKVHRKRNATAPADQRQWMDRLNTLRDSIGTGQTNLTSEQIIAESREERS